MMSQVAVIDFWKRCFLRGKESVQGKRRWRVIAKVKLWCQRCGSQESSLSGWILDSDLVAVLNLAVLICC